MRLKKMNAVHFYEMNVEDGRSCWVWKLKPMWNAWTCILTKGQQGEATLVAERILVVFKSVGKNDPASRLICALSKHFTDGILVSTASFMSC